MPNLGLIAVAVFALLMLSPVALTLYTAVRDYRRRRNRRLARGRMATRREHEASWN